MTAQPDLFSQPPFVAGSHTSYEASQAIKPERANLRQRVYDYVAAHPGVTDQQIAAGTGLDPSTVRPRRVELARAGQIELVGFSHTTSGRKAQAWAVKCP
jgi:hypothetical protein